MFYPKQIISNEYFPQDIPPCFSSKNVSNHYDHLKGKAANKKGKNSIPYTYSGFKSEKSRRKYAIPNICGFINLVNCLDENAAEIFPIFEESNYSLTKPLIGFPPADKPYKKLCYNVSEAKQFVENLYQNNMYEIRLDIMSFFDSIYTHSIPWVIHTKQFAKANRHIRTLLGNKLDSFSQRINHGQTNGILVGNAASRIISEIMLCKIDEKIDKEFPDLKCCRFVDDYYIYIKNSSEIQSVISFVRNELGKYELQLNENKLQINESPFTFEKKWLGEIKLFIHLNSEVFFDKTISLYKDFKDISIIRYGLAILSLHNYSEKEWKVMESKLINLWVAFPSLSNQIIKFFYRNKNYIRKTYIKNGIYSIIEKCVELKYEGELVWSVWIAKVFGIKLNEDYICKILSSSNCLATIIALDIINSSSRISKLVKRQIKSLVDDLYVCDINNGSTGYLIWSEQWLLAYEAEINEWLKKDGDVINFASSNDFFKEMLDLDIRFYNKEYELDSLCSTGTNMDNLQYVTKKEFKAYIERVNTNLADLAENTEINIPDYEEIFLEFINRIYSDINIY